MHANNVFIQGVDAFAANMSVPFPNPDPGPPAPLRRRKLLCLLWLLLEIFYVSICIILVYNDECILSTLFCFFPLTVS